MVQVRSSSGAAVLMDQAAENVHPFDQSVIVHAVSPDEGWHQHPDVQAKTTTRTGSSETLQIGSLQPVGCKKVGQLLRLDHSGRFLCGREGQIERVREC
jgi:hypothetical protein